MSSRKTVQFFSRDIAIKLIVREWRRCGWPEFDIMEWEMELGTASNARLATGVHQIVYKNDPNIEIEVIDHRQSAAMEYGDTAEYNDWPPGYYHPRSPVLPHTPKAEEVLCPVARSN